MIPSLGNVDATTVQELVDIVARYNKEIQFILEGNIDAENIRANSITANLIKAGTITADKLSVSTLSAIAADLGTITAGSISGTTITGGTVRTSASGGRIEMTGSQISVYDPLTSVLSAALTPQAGFNEPGFQLFDKYTGNEALNISKYHFSGNDYGVYINTKNSNNLTIDVAGNLAIYCSGTAVLPAHNQAWSTITSKPTTLSGYGITDAASSSHTHTRSQITDFSHTHSISDITSLQSSLDGKASSSHTHSISDVTFLQSSLDAKALKSASTGSNTVTISGGSHNHGIADGTVLRKADGGTVTWSAYGGFTLNDGGHSHTQN